MEEKNKKTKKGNKNISKKTTKKVNAKKEVKEKVEVKEVEAKKQVYKKINNESNAPVTSNEMANLIKIVLAVTAVFLIFYGITTLVTDKEDETGTDSGEVTIQYDEILLGTLFEQSNSEYYVLVTTEDDLYASTYSSLLSTYTAKENAIRVYNANLDNGFNKSYKSEEANISNNLKELKLTGSTLLKIKDKTIVASYQGNTEIIDHLNSLL